jgi:hypothetical protein
VSCAKKESIICAVAPWSNNKEKTIHDAIVMGCSERGRAIFRDSALRHEKDMITSFWTTGYCGKNANKAKKEVQMQFFSKALTDEQALQQAVLKGDIDLVKSALQRIKKIEFPKENLSSRFHSEIDAEHDGRHEDVFPFVNNTVLHDFFTPMANSHRFTLWPQGKKRNIEILRILLEHPGVTPNVVGQHARNVLQVAFESDRDDKYACLELLLEHGADMFFAGRGSCFVDTVARTPDAGAKIDEALFEWLIKRSPNKWPHDFCNLVITRDDVRSLLFEAIEQRLFLEACGERSIEHGWMTQDRQSVPTQDRRTVYRLCDYAYKRLPKPEAIKTWGQKWRYIVHEQSSFMRHIWVTLPGTLMLRGAESAFAEWDCESDANACQIASEKDMVVKLLQKEGIDCSALLPGKNEDEERACKRQKIV